MLRPPNAGIKFVTIIRRWLHENFTYKFDYSEFGIANILHENACLHVKLSTTRRINEREEFTSSVTACWFDGVRCVVLGHEVNLVNVEIKLSDPEFFEKLHQTLTVYLNAFEKVGYVFPRR
jgi:hypothetical protein